MPPGTAQFIPPAPKEMPLPMHSTASLSEDLEAFPHHLLTAQSDRLCVLHWCRDTEQGKTGLI